MLSLFVAVILDNLELDEDIKKVKQLKAREQSAGFNEDLPFRLRLFESFPDSPQMTRLHKTANEFVVPKVRDSFMRAFVDTSGGVVTTSGSTTSGPTSGARTGQTTTTAKSYSGGYYLTNSSYMNSAAAASAAAAAKQQLLAANYNFNGYLTAASKLFPPMLSSSSTVSGVFTTTTAGTGRNNAAELSGHGYQKSTTNYKYNFNSSGTGMTVIRSPFGKKQQGPLKLLNPVSKGRHSSPLLRRVQVACIVHESNNQRLLMGELNANNVGLTRAMPPTAASVLQSVAAAGVGAHRTGLRRSVRNNFRDEVGTDETGQANGPGGGKDFDFKMLQRKRQQAEMRRTQRESDLRENHPFFDTPLLLIGRESRFRMLCQNIVGSKYDPHVRDPVTGKERKMRYKGAHELLGLVPYCDWIMIVITTVSCASMMCETGETRVANTPVLIVAEYAFVITMACELMLKTMADGLLFTPNAYLANVAGVMDFIIFSISVLFLMALPEEIPPQSWSQTLLVARCIRPLRIFSLVPHMRKVVYELCRGFKEIALVSVLLVVLLFVFASVGVHLFGGRLARCNDPCVKERVIIII